MLGCASCEVTCASRLNRATISSLATSARSTLRDPLARQPAVRREEHRAHAAATELCLDRVRACDDGADLDHSTRSYPVRSGRRTGLSDHEDDGC
jgi:hypothetical protein